MTPSEILLRDFKKAVKSRGDNMHNAATTMGVKYITLYSNVTQRKKNARKGPPQFTYDFGLKLSQYINAK